MAYGLYNPSETYYKPKFWLAKPNKQIITRLKEIDTKSSLKVMFGQVNEVSFTIPYYKEKDNQTTINPSIEMINAKYLLKMEFMDNVEWFVIEKFSKEVGEDDTIPATAYSLQYELSFKKIYEIEETSVLPDAIIKQVLDKTGWTIGTIDPILAKKYRSYTFSNTSTLDCLYQIAEICNGILQFDTVAQTVSLYDEKTLSKFNGLILNDKNYLNTLTDAKSASEIVTRLYPIGNEGITINSENPSGTSYLEDFSYFLYPFKRDPITKKTISSSLYFSDELSHATLDYQDIIREKSPSIKEKATRRDAINLEITALKTDLAAKQSKLDQINDITDIMKSNREFIAKSIGNSEHTLDLRGGHQFVQFRTLKGTATVTFNGVAYNATTAWTTFKKDFNVDTKVKLKIAGSTDKIQFYVARISTEENTTGIQADIIAKYNAFPVIDSINVLKSSIATKEAELKIVVDELSAIHDLISVASNFSDELIKERNRYIFEEYWVEDNHVNAKELYEDALEQFKKINKPSTTMNIDIVNFLSMVGEVRNWLKLTIGSKLRVKYEKLNIRSESILIGIDYDFETNSINLTVSDTADLMTDEERLVKMIYASSSSSNYLALKKFIYDDAVSKSNAVEQLLNETWDANLRRIVAGVNESVEISKRGIVIRNPNFPNDILVAVAGAIMISDDNGLSFKNAITTSGVVAEQILGQVIIGERVWIEDDNGIVKIKGDQIEIKDNFSLPRVTMGQYEEGKFGIKVENGAIEIVGGLKKDQLSTDALLAMEGSLSDRIGGFITALINFKAEIFETFQDGVITEKDRAIINNGIKQIDLEKKLLDAKFDTLYGNPILPIVQKDALNLAKVNLGEPIGTDSRHVKLIEKILLAIEDNQIIQSEADEVIIATGKYTEALELLAQRAEEAELSIIDSGVKQLRTDLRMTDPLPTSIKIDENGFTAYQTDVTKFARMDYRGLYVQGGAIDIRTSSATNRGIVFDGNGLRGYNATGTNTFNLDTNGNLTLTGYAKFTDLSSVSGTMINAGNIKTGTINADLVAIANNKIRLDSNGLYVYKNNVIGAQLTEGNLIFNDQNTGERIGAFSATTWKETAVMGVSLLMEENRYITFGNYIGATIGYTSMMTLNPGTNMLDTPRGISMNLPVRANDDFWMGTKGIRFGLNNTHSHAVIYKNAFDNLALACYDTVEIDHITAGGVAVRKFSVDSDLIHMYQDVDVHGWKLLRVAEVQQSSNDYLKTDISSWQESALDKINASVVYDYKLKKDMETGKARSRQGLVLGDSYSTPHEFIEQDFIDVYQMTSWSWKGIQELSHNLSNHDKKINNLEIENQLLKHRISLLEEKAV